MSFLGISIKKTKKRASSFNPFDDSLFYPLSNARTNSGVSVSPDTAMRITAVFCAVNILSGAIGSLPIWVYEQIDEDTKRKDTNHPVYKILSKNPNPWQTPIEFKTLMGLHYLLRGNAYAQILFNQSGGISKLIPLNPDRMTINISETGLPVYTHRKENGTSRTYQRWQILHIKGLSQDGYKGLSPIDQCREAIGLASASEEFAARFYSNDASPGGVLRHPETLSEEVHKRIKDSWKSSHAGGRNAHEIAILEEGMEFQPISLKAEDVQFLEARNFQIFEIARIFNLPPHMLKDLSRATWGNIESEDIGYVKHSLRPHLITFEQVFERDLLSLESTDGKEFAIEYDVDGLLRGDVKSRTYSYMVGIQNGWLSINDVRRRENLNPIPNGDTHFVPTNNMTPLDVAVNQTDDEVSNVSDMQKEEGEGEDKDDEISNGKNIKEKNSELKLFELQAENQFLQISQEIIDRFVTKELSAARTELKRMPGKLPMWAFVFYEEQRDILKKQLTTSVNNLLETICSVRALFNDDSFHFIKSSFAISTILDQFTQGYRDEAVECFANSKEIDVLIEDWRKNKASKKASLLLIKIKDFIERGEYIWQKNQ